MLDVITLALILGPCDLPAGKSTPELEDSARRVCVALELCGPKEYPERYAYHVWVNWARCELPKARRLPHLELCRGLCGHKWAQDNHRLACAHCAALDVDGEDFWRLDAYRQEAFNRRWYWQRVAVAVDEQAPYLHRRDALRQLVDSLGWRAVLTGELPAPIPPLPQR